MLRDLFHLLLRKRAYAWVSLALGLSSIGTAFTTIAVYGELLKHQASAIYFSWAFVLALVPGLITSRLTARYSIRIPLSSLLIAGEIFGALFLILPMIGTLQGNLALLLSAECLGSAIMGALAPILQLYVKRVFENDELPLISIYGVYLFTAHFIFGQGLGTILYAVLDTPTFLIFDFFTYCVSAVVIALASRLDASGMNAPVESEKSDLTFAWKDFSLIQRRVFWMMPLLSILCAPLMSLLPVRGAELTSTISIGWVVVSPALTFLLFRTLGQLLGPLVIRRVNFDSLLANTRLLGLCAVLYLALYWIIFTTDVLSLAIVCIVLAHISSNVIYTAASYGFMRHFNEHQIRWATSRNYQLSVLATAGSSLAGGWIVQWTPPSTLVLIALLPLTVWWHHLWKQSGEVHLEKGGNLAL